MQEAFLIWCLTIIFACIIMLVCEGIASLYRWVRRKFEKPVKCEDIMGDDSLTPPLHNALPIDKIKKYLDNDFR